MVEKRYGKYRAIVMDINDPERRGRIRVQCPKVLGNYLSAWCEPCIPYATDFAGDFYVPPVGEAIWVEFEEGDVDKPIWNGGWYRSNSTPMLPQLSPDEYRYIVFKNAVIRMGDSADPVEGSSEGEIVYNALVDGKLPEKGGTLILNAHSCGNLEFIGERSNYEMDDLSKLIANEWFLLEVVHEGDVSPRDGTVYQGDSLSVVISKITDGLTELSNDLKTLSDSHNELSIAYNVTAGTVEIHDARIASLEGRVGSLETTVADLSGRVKSVEDSLNSLWNYVTHQKTDWDEGGLEQKIYSYFDYIKAQYNYSIGKFDLEIDSEGKVTYFNYDWKYM